MKTIRSRPLLPAALLALMAPLSCGPEEGPRVSPPTVTAPPVEPGTASQPLASIDIWRPRQVAPLFAEPGTRW